MRISNRIPQVLLWFAAVAAAASVTFASTNADLSRDTPVPATEQVPIVDFVRLPLIWEPQLNLAGNRKIAVDL